MHEALMSDSMREERDHVTLDLWQRMNAATSDEEFMRLREELFLLYENLSFSFGKQYMNNKRLSPDDIRQCCRIGVIVAINAWDPERGSLSTMVAYRVSLEIKTWLRWEQIYLPTSSSDQDDVSQELCQPQTPRKCELTYVSFDTLQAHRGDGEEFDFFEVTLAHSSPGPEGEVVLKVAIESALSALAPENRGLVEMCYGLNGQPRRTQREIVPLFEKSMTHQGINARLSRSYRQMAPLLDGF
jgi:hypothetical protein